MTAHDALTAIQKQVLDAPISHEAPRVALVAIRNILERRKLQAWTPALPTQPGWYGFKEDFPYHDLFLYDLMYLSPCDDHVGLWVSKEECCLEEMPRTGQWKGPLDLEAL